MRKAEEKASEQECLSQIFQQNQAKVARLRETDRASIVPDLCTSSIKQLRQLHGNYGTLKDISKYALCVSSLCASGRPHTYECII